ncbi:MAG: hypothetical protein OQJ98_03090 [Candidatus Pacebacteria bacterium]|nr:hypothetical protein [Candidatus Paceibacterota bacterium]
MKKRTKILLIIIIVFSLSLGVLFFAYQHYLKDTFDFPMGMGVDGKGGGGLFPTSGTSSGDARDTLDAPADEDVYIPTLRQISRVPSVRGIILTEETETRIRYIERATGHIYEVGANSLQEERLSNTTIPRIQEVVWSPEGDAVILRYLDENETLRSFYGEIIKEDNELDGWFLTNNIIGLSVHPDGDLFYLQQTSQQVDGFLSNFDGTNSRLLFSSTVYDWTPHWFGDDITLTSKASRSVVGHTYRLRSGSLTEIISGEGLVATPNQKGTTLLISKSGDAGTELAIYNTRTEDLSILPFRTLAEKCAWANDTKLYCGSPYSLDRSASYPDDWYKGIVSFSDDIWVFDTETSRAQLIYDAEEAGYDLDVINISVDPEEQLLIFTNKKDSTLWALSLK